MLLLSHPRSMLALTFGVALLVSPAIADNHQRLQTDARAVADPANPGQASHSKVRARKIAIRHRSHSRHIAGRSVTPPRQPSTAELQQAVRNLLVGDPSLLRGSLAELLRNDSDIRQMMTPPVAANEPAKATPVPAPAPVSTPSTAGGADQAQVERIVREYLMSHPEVLQEASAELEKRQAAADAEKSRVAIKDNAPQIFGSARQVNLGNPQGDVTLVEFFDYNCAYCKRAMSDMLDLIKTDPKLHVVLKEFPVLGEGSVAAAQVAVAVRMQDKTGKKYLDFHQKLLGGRGQADKARAMAVAKEVGMDMGRIEKDLSSDEVKSTLEEDFKLAEALGVNGTPSYVVGPEMAVGAVGLDSLKQKINNARCGKESC